MLSGLRQLSGNESFLKSMKNPSYFTLKGLFVRYIFLAISKLITSQGGKHVIAIGMLPNISKSTNNQTMKFGQLIKCSMKNNFLEKLFTNLLKKLLPDPFLNNQNRANNWIISLTFYAACF